MTRVYNYGDNTQITEHFKASELEKLRTRSLLISMLIRCQVCTWINVWNFSV